MANKKHTTDPEKDEEIKSSSSRGSSLLTDLDAQAEESVELNAGSQKKQTQAQKNRMQSFFIAGSALVVAIVGIFGVAMYNNNQNSEQADASTPTVWISRFYRARGAHFAHTANHYYTNNPNIVWTGHGTWNHTPEDYGYRFEGTRFGLYRATGSRCPANTRMLNVYWATRTRIDHALGFTRPASPANYRFAEHLGCIATRRLSGTVPLYHFWDSVGQNNFYTTNLTEGRGITGTARNRIIGYVNPRVGTQPVYEFFNARRNDNYYTTNMNDGTARRPEYVFQGSPFVVYRYNQRTGRCSISGTSPLMIWYHKKGVNHYYRILDTPGVRPTHERTLRGWGYRKVMERRKHKALGCIRTAPTANTKPLYGHFDGARVNHRYIVTGNKRAGSVVGHID